MEWNHKGVMIEATAAGTFRAVFDGTHISKGSLSAVKKDIDKRLEEKAKEVTLSLPVVVLRASDRFSGTKREIDSAVITGIDRNSLKAIGHNIEAKAGWKNDEILPESKENKKLLHDYVQAEAEFNRLKELVDRRSVDTYFGSAFSVRNKIQYHEAVKKLEESYAKAKKSEAD